jgi:hypothetical protein
VQYGREHLDSGVLVDYDVDSGFLRRGRAAVDTTSRANSSALSSYGPSLVGTSRAAKALDFDPLADVRTFTDLRRSLPHARMAASPLRILHVWRIG